MFIFLMFVGNVQKFGSDWFGQSEKFTIQLIQKVSGSVKHESGPAKDDNYATSVLWLRHKSSNLINGTSRANGLIMQVEGHIPLL